MVLFLISIRRGVFGTGVPLESFTVEVDLRDSLQTSLVNIVSATDLNSRSYKKIYSGQHIDQCSVGKIVILYNFRARYFISVYHTDQSLLCYT